jgi:hypothetical protein
VAALQMPEPAEITRAAQRGLMRSSDVAAFLGVSRQRVDQLSVSGDLSAPRPCGRAPHVGAHRDRGLGGPALVGNPPVEGAKR